MNDLIFKDSLNDAEFKKVLSSIDGIEKVKTGLTFVMMLREFIAIDFKAIEHRFPHYSDPTQPPTIIHDRELILLQSESDFLRLYHHHRAQFKNQFPLATDHQFRTRYSAKAERLLLAISELLPTHIDTHEFIACERYKNEYLSGNHHHKAARAKKTTYTWMWPHDELKDLFHALRDDKKLIAPETTYQQFEYIFTGQPIEAVTPIRWHDDNATELTYFIVRLERTDCIEHNPKRTDYEKLKGCFVKPDGKPFNANFKELKNKMEFNLSEVKKSPIDSLIDSML